MSVRAWKLGEVVGAMVPSQYPTISHASCQTFTRGGCVIVVKGYVRMDRLEFESRGMHEGPHKLLLPHIIRRISGPIPVLRTMSRVRPFSALIHQARLTISIPCIILCVGIERKGTAAHVDQSFKVRRGSRAQRACTGPKHRPSVRPVLAFAGNKTSLAAEFVRGSLGTFVYETILGDDGTWLVGRVPNIGAWTSNTRPERN